MNILIYGIGGRMGRVVYSTINSDNELNVVCGVDKFLDNNDFNVPVYKEIKDVKEKIDCIIDFSNHVNVNDYLPYAKEKNIPCVIASTGFDVNELQLINETSKYIPILKSGNMSLGINLLLQMSKLCAKVLGDKADIEIIEQHHNKKLDAPSGTALLLADGIKSVNPEYEYNIGRNGLSPRKKNEIGINAVRGGTIVGKHDVMFILDNEVITLKHEAESRQIFANGSISAAKFIVKQTPGLYSMEDLFN